jgi:putative iron-dependent peroxidase
MDAPQPGIFALSDAAHIFLEFTLNSNAPARRLVELAVGLHEPYTTVGGINLVLGVRPDLWRALAPNDAPDDTHDFSETIAGIEGFTIPATQSDLWVWLAAESYDRLWDAGRATIERLTPVARLERHVSGWPYRRSRDLTGFEDGTENPTLLEAPEIALVATGRKGAGASIVLFQKWRHQESWFRLSVGAQEAAMGRTKADSVEFEGDRVVQTSHVSRAKDVVDGDERDIFRRNVPYGDVVDYGTTFIGFSCEQSRLHRMLVRMAGAEDGIRDEITRYTTPLTGAYYVVPSVTALGPFAPPTEE